MVVTLSIRNDRIYLVSFSFGDENFDENAVGEIVGCLAVTRAKFVRLRVARYRDDAGDPERSMMSPVS